MCDPERGAKARPEIQTNAGGRSTAWERGRGKCRGKKEGPKEAAGGKTTRERVTLLVGEGRRKLWSAFEFWSQACGIHGAAHNQNRAGELEACFGKRGMQEGKRYFLTMNPSGSLRRRLSSWRDAWRWSTGYLFKVGLQGFPPWPFWLHTFGSKIGFSNWRSTLDSQN